jgi:hypothetical protein
MEARPIKENFSLHNYSFRNLEKYNSLRSKKEASTRARKPSSGRNFPLSTGKVTFSARQGYCYALL